ncbi:hypothetical protein D9V74_02280 [Buchnera aphidicola (Macrosiphoniella sanborni)]|uniref:DNA polymerase III tau subunit domain-containing protein n=1 Tax=Buchnera aphidicola (Macrosiphoniella sanborni) TaxID=1241865 RepID=A0A4D6YEJ1_9GAMM|nr:DNA polymerase III subunit gamma/tau C-terminal domain-containing protein [Buchnera aphidicola]QCI23990.1 hypothetical protein D9V74_02280 [Buchnera aphidicola (Macrosiphoniella sanborni)]
MNHQTYLLLKNRNELFQKIKNTVSLKNNIKKYHTYISKNYFLSEENNFLLTNINNKNLIILKEKIKIIDPWYKKICQLKKLSENVQTLAINTVYKSTKNYWYIFLSDTKKYLIKNNTWNIFSKLLSKITKKKIQLIITKNALYTLTPKQWFFKIYNEMILHEYSFLMKDSNIKTLKNFFNINISKNNINLV